MIEPIQVWLLDDWPHTAVILKWLATYKCILTLGIHGATSSPLWFLGLHPHPGDNWRYILTLRIFGVTPSPWGYLGLHPHPGDTWGYILTLGILGVTSSPWGYLGFIGNIIYELTWISVMTTIALYLHHIYIHSISKTIWLMYANIFVIQIW